MRATRLAVAALALVALTGCATTPVTPTNSAAPAASPAPSTTASVSPPEVPAPVAQRLILSGDGFSILDEQGEVLEQDTWLVAERSISAALEAAFGAAPEVVERSGDGFHYPATYSVLVWPGFELAMITMSGEGQAQAYVTAAEVRGIAIESASGIHVGLTTEDALARSPYHQVEYPGSGPRYFFDPVAVTDTEPYATSGVRADSDGAVITALVAPSSDAL